MLPWGFIEGGWELLLDDPSGASVGYSFEDFIEDGWGLQLNAPSVAKKYYKKVLHGGFHWMLLWGFVKNGWELLV